MYLQHSLEMQYIAMYICELIKYCQFRGKIDEYEGGLEIVRRIKPIYKDKIAIANIIESNIAKYNNSDLSDIFNSVVILVELVEKLKQYHDQWYWIAKHISDDCRENLRYYLSDDYNHTLHYSKYFIDIAVELGLKYRY